MQPKLIRFFVYSAGSIFLITAVAKFISAGGSARLLQMPDPVLVISFRALFWLVGIIEMVIAYFCFFSKRSHLQITLIGWLATSFLLYRLGRMWVGRYKPCSCLGNLTDALHIQTQTADVAMKIILLYLLIGSYGALFWLWRQRKKEVVFFN